MVKAVNKFFLTHELLGILIPEIISQHARSGSAGLFLWYGICYTEANYRKPAKQLVKDKLMRKFIIFLNTLIS
jgi:hypothetical protein